MRTTLAIAFLAPLTLLAACGDGIDERYDRAEAGAVQAAVTTTTVAPEPPAELEVDSLATTLVDTRADFSGVRNVMQLSDGSWLLSGFDNHSDRSQPEPGAVWRSDDLKEWERVGDGISDDDNQQVIDTLVEIDGVVIAAGSDFSRYGADDFGQVADAAVWVSDDNGVSFERSLLRRDAAVAGAAVLGDEVWVWGFEFDEDMVARGQIWRSDDRGESWRDLSPMASPGHGAAPGPIGPIGELVQWESSLVAVGLRSDTDPDGLDYPLDDVALGSATEAWEPVDVGIWYSDDLGDSWRTATPTGLAGVADAQVVSSALIVGDQLVLAGAAADPSTSSPDDSFGFGDAKFVATAWICDHALQHCAATELDSSSHDGVAATMIEFHGRVIIGITMYDFESSAEEDLVAVLDPITGLSSATPLDTVRQVGALVIRDATLHVYGRTTSTDDLTAGTAPLEA